VKLWGGIRSNIFALVFLGWTAEGVDQSSSPVQIDTIATADRAFSFFRRGADAAENAVTDDEYGILL
jgi:hypothetical protein